MRRGGGTGASPSVAAIGDLRRVADYSRPWKALSRPGISAFHPPLCRQTYSDPFRIPAAVFLYRRIRAREAACMDPGMQTFRQGDFVHP